MFAIIFHLLSNIEIHSMQTTSKLESMNFKYSAAAKPDIFISLHTARNL